MKKFGDGRYGAACRAIPLIERSLNFLAQSHVLRPKQPTLRTPFIMRRLFALVPRFDATSLVIHVPVAHQLPLHSGCRQRFMNSSKAGRSLAL